MGAANQMRCIEIVLTIGFRIPGNRIRDGIPGENAQIGNPYRLARLADTGSLLGGCKTVVEQHQRYPADQGSDDKVYELGAIGHIHRAPPTARQTLIE